MTPAARLQATIEILESIAAQPRPADALVGAYFRARRYMGSHDRNAVATRLYAVLRHQARLDWWLKEEGLEGTEGRIEKELPSPSRGGVGEGGLGAGVNTRPPPPAPRPRGAGEILSHPRLRTLAWLALGEQISAKVIDELCSGGKFAPAVLSDVERGFLKKITGNTITHPDMPDEISAECPTDMVDVLRKRFGKNFMREMRAMQEPAPLDLRVNIIKATRDDMLVALQKLGLQAELCTLSPWGIRVYDRPSLADIKMLKDGLIDIQDEGSQLVAKITDAKPGERVVDFCAGAGGKTLAIAAMMHNKGRIIACDIMEKRLMKSSERFRRAGLHNIELRPLTGTRDPWVKKHKHSFDRVLVDAPCSGTGTWRRNPDARWHNLGPPLADLLKTQAEILDSAARLVKPGGRLIYATCSLLPAENEEQIEAFLATHPEFALFPCGLGDTPYLSLTPAQHGTDGFFGAVMVRASVSAAKTAG